MIERLGEIRVGGQVVGEEVRIRHTFLRPAHEGGFPLHTMIHRFMEWGFYRDLNSLFGNIRSQNPQLPLVTIEKEAGAWMVLNHDFPPADGSVALDTVEEQNGIYCSDFQVKLGDMYSLPMRFSADTRRWRVPRLGQIGVRSVLRHPPAPRGNIGLGVRRARGDMIMRGGAASCWTDLTLSGNSLRVTRPFPSLVEENSAQQWIECNFSYIVTESAFFLFTRKGGVIKNIISLVKMEERGSDGNYVWYTNGWAEDLGTEQNRRLPARARWDAAVAPLRQALVSPYRVRRGRGANARYFEAMGVNVSNEHRMFVGSESRLGRGIDMETLQRESTQRFICMANTTPLMFRRVAEVSGFRSTIVTPDRNGASIFAAVTAILNNAPVRDFFTNQQLNLVFFRASGVGRVISAGHYFLNSLPNFFGRILDQHAGPAANARMGFVWPFGNNVQKSDNACGWVAAYNAFQEIGRFVEPARIIHFIERNNGLILDGMWGTNPRIYGPLFRSFNVRALVRTIESELNRWARGDRVRTTILCYINQGGIQNGAHYVTATWNRTTELYTAYNVRWDRPTFEFRCIHEFLRDNTGGFIALVTIE